MAKVLRREDDDDDEGRFHVMMSRWSQGWGFGSAGLGDVYDSVDTGGEGKPRKVKTAVVGDVVGLFERVHVCEVSYSCTKGSGRRL